MTSILRVAAAARQVFCGTLRPVTSESHRCLQTLTGFTSCTPTTLHFSNCISSSAAYASTVSPTLISTPPFACSSKLLSVTKQLGPITLTHSRSYHVRLALKKRCSSCYFVRRKGRLFVDCKAKPRHKQMQMMSKRKTWKEDYSEGNIQKAIFWKYDGEKQYYKVGDNQYARYSWLKEKIGVTV